MAVVTMAMMLVLAFVVPAPVFVLAIIISIGAVIVIVLVVTVQRMAVGLAGITLLSRIDLTVAAQLAPQELARRLVRRIVLPAAGTDRDTNR